MLSYKVKRFGDKKKIIFLASQCAPLPEAPHSNITILNGGGRSYGTIVRFECEPGYVRSGHPVILCMSNGTWSDEVPTCSRKYNKLCFSLIIINTRNFKSALV